MQKSVAHDLFQGVQFALFGLGDRAYGPQFCAAARKLAIRFVQLGAQLVGEPGYGDDGTPRGGVFVDLDVWIQSQLFSSISALLEKQESRHPEQVETVVLGQQQQEQGMAAASEVEPNITTPNSFLLPYQINISETEFLHDEGEEWNHPDFREAYNAFFESRRPASAYHYTIVEDDTIAAGSLLRRNNSNDHRLTGNNQRSLLLARIVNNQRLTAADWVQDTRHLRLSLIENTTLGQPIDRMTPPVANISSTNASGTTTTWDQDNLPYQAGDVVSILPSNAKEQVERFLSVLPFDIQNMAHRVLNIEHATQTLRQELHGDKSNYNTAVDSFVCFNRWPSRCTLYGWLKYCADIQGLPEREDLWALSNCCSMDHPQGQAQRDKLRQLSESTGSALYNDYILREKRNWADLLYDFDSLRAPSTQVLNLASLPILMSLLSPLRPREFSIASSPSKEFQAITNRDEQQQNRNGLFGIDLCVAVVEGRTPLGRSYNGLCSDYLCRRQHPEIVRCWIRPGSFQQLPLSITRLAEHDQCNEPVLYIGAGTGIAPLRGLIHERSYARGIGSIQDEHNSNAGLPAPTDSIWDKDDVLIFGCRKQSSDFYYSEEWEEMTHHLGLRTAFSQDQWHKIYVQQVLKGSDPTGEFLMAHLQEKNGSIYIAGGANMARAVKDEIVELLSKVRHNREMPETGATTIVKQWLAKLQRQGRFRVEAWN